MLLRFTSQAKILPANSQFKIRLYARLKILSRDAAASLTSEQIFLNF